MTRNYFKKAYIPPLLNSRPVRCHHRKPHFLEPSKSRGAREPNLRGIRTGGDASPSVRTVVAREAPAPGCELGKQQLILWTSMGLCRSLSLDPQEGMAREVLGLKKRFWGLVPSYLLGCKAPFPPPCALKLRVVLKRRRHRGKPRKPETCKRNMPSYPKKRKLGVNLGSSARNSFAARSKKRKPHRGPE